MTTKRFEDRRDLWCECVPVATWLGRKFIMEDRSF